MGRAPSTGLTFFQLSMSLVSWIVPPKPVACATQHSHPHKQQVQHMFNVQRALLWLRGHLAEDFVQGHCSV